MADPQDWRTRAIGALGAVLAVALVVGGVVGAVAYGAAQVTGLTGGDPVALDPGSPGSSSASSSTSSSSASPSQAPAPSRTAGSSAPATPSHSPSPTPTTTDAPEHAHRKTHHHRKHPASGSLTLSASPHHVGHMGRIDLSGHYRGHDGTTLVVQRLEGGHWTRFPVTAQVRGGDFHTWVASGHPGPNRFRVVDQGTGAASDAVTVVVG
jgi:hypothetical protein